jgi:hypothetical protein
MDWENIGKASVMLICSFAGVGLIYLIVRIVSWKWHVDSKIELQDEVNKELFQVLKDIKATIDEAISKERNKE